MTTALALLACEEAPTLHVRQSGLPDAGQWRSAFAVGDLDGDGALDLLHGPPRQAPGLPRSWSLRGDRFTATELAWPQAPYDYGAAAIADLDGDGDNDAAFAMHTLGVRVVLREGGRFRDAGLVPFSARQLVAAQLDDDPALELAALADGPLAGGAGDNTGVAVFDVDPVGDVRYRVIGASRGLVGDAIVTTDVDGDGRADLVCGSNVRGFAHLVYLRRADDFETRVVPLGPQDVVTAVAGLPTGLGGGLVFAVSPPGVTPPSRLLRWNAIADDVAWVSTTHRVTALTAVSDGLVALTADGDALRFSGLRLRAGSAVRVSPGCAGQHVQALEVGTKEPSTLLASFGSERSATCTRGGAIVLLAAP